MRGGGSARVSFTWLGDAMKVASAAARARRRQVAARVHFLHIMTILHEHRARARMHVCVYVCAYVCMYVYGCIYIYT